MGGALGSRLARLLGRESSGEPDSEVFLGWAGFVHLFSSEEVHQLALDAGMRLVWEAAPGPSYPCVTFLQE
jgi:hypothetical protein